MYEIKCPNCQRGQATPFARIGAIAQCPGCEHCFRIDDRCVRRTMNESIDQSLQADEELRARIGLSGLSEVMRQEGPPVQPTFSHAIPGAPSNRNAPPAPTRPGQHPSHGEQRPQPLTPNQRKVLYVMAGFGGFAFLVVVVLLLILLYREVVS